MKNNIEGYYKSQQSSQEKIDSFLKQLMVVFTTLFGLLISLHSNDECEYKRTVFTISIALIACGILCAAACLFGEVEFSVRVQNAWKKRVQRERQNPGQIEQDAELHKNKIFGYAEKLCYLFFLLSLISLVFYSAIRS